jgi:hypothetical protein
VRSFSITTALRQDKSPVPPKEPVPEDASLRQEEEGAMTRRLAEMVEETIDTGSKSDRKLMQDVGFSDELKKQLEERIAQTAFAGQNQQATSQVKMPVCSRVILSVMPRANSWVYRLLQAKVLEISQAHSHGLVPKLYMTPLYECWTTATRNCGRPTSHRPFL